MIRVGFTGAGGSGKGSTMKGIQSIREDGGSTFFPYLNKSYVQDIGQFISQDSKSYKDIVGMNALMKQCYIFGGQMQSEMILQAKCKLYEHTTKERSVLISERSSIDYMAYATQCMEEFSELDSYLDLARRWAYKNYDLLVYFPIEFNPDDTKENPWKERDPESRQNTDWLIRLTLDTLKDIPQLTVTGTIEERSRQIIKYITENWDSLEKK